MNNVLSVTSTASCLGLRVPWAAKNVRCANVVKSFARSLRCSAVRQDLRPLSTRIPLYKSTNGLQVGSRVRPNNPQYFDQISKQTTLLSRATYAKAARPHKKVPQRHGPKQYVANGVPTQEQTPTDREFREIFGPTVDKKTGHNVIQLLQAQRIAGTLDQGITAQGVSEHMTANALAWLRGHKPVDEDAAIVARLDEEDRQTERVYIPQQNPADSHLTGHSVLQAIKDERDKADAEAEAKRANAPPDASAPAPNTTGKALAARRAHSAAWVQKYRAKAIFSTSAEPPPLTHFQRLWPSTLLTLSVVTLSVLVAQNYSPPKRTARLLPDLPPAAATLLVLMNVNFAVFLLWRVPLAWPVLNRYAMMIPGAPRAFSMIGAVFSHQKPLHLVSNMAFLWYFGSKLHDDIGRGSFLAVYFATGALSSYFSLTVNVLRRYLITSSIGASGAIMGVIGAWLAYHSDATFSLIFLPSDLLPSFSSYVILFILIAFEVAGIRLQWRRSDHLGHLGGLLSGIASAHFLKDRARQRKEAEASRTENLGLVERVQERRL